MFIKTQLFNSDIIFQVSSIEKISIKLDSEVRVIDTLLLLNVKMKKRQNFIFKIYQKM